MTDGATALAGSTPAVVGAVFARGRATSLKVVAGAYKNANAGIAAVLVRKVASRTVTISTITTLEGAEILVLGIVLVVSKTRKRRESDEEESKCVSELHFVKDKKIRMRKEMRNCLCDVRSNC